jgi:hypothetical protein
MAGEVADIHSLVRESADRVLLAMNGETFWAAYILGNIAAALSVTEGMEAAHEYTNNVVNTLDMHPGEKADTWIKLYALGDTAALKPARRAIGLAGEDVPFVEAIGAMELGGLHSAERMVALAVAGDTEMLPIARKMAEGVYPTESTALLAKLYTAGDRLSLEPAIAAAQRAAEYCESTGDQHYYRSETALAEMAVAAANQGELEDAYRLLPTLQEARNRASVHVALYKQGVEASAKEAAAYATDAGEMGYDIGRQLAAAGHGPSLRALKRRLRRDNYGWYTESKFSDVLVLHDLGDESASRKLEKAVLSENHREYYIGHLMMAGLQQEAADLATDVYRTEPTETNAVYVWETDPTVANWQQAFDKSLERSDAAMSLNAAGLIRALAQRALR